MAGPLEGIRVLDFGRYIAGPYCAMLLADLGADVVRVERREGGEDRHVGPVVPNGEGGLFLNLNRNKRGMTLDLGNPRAKDVLRRAIATTDIVVANLPANVLRGAGLDYESLRTIRDDIILVHATAFGSEGAQADRVGFDAVVQAMSGAMGLTGFAPTPVRSVVSFEDYGTALHGAVGALAAILERQSTGKGKKVEVSLLATGITFMLPYLAEHLLTTVRRTQWGNTSFYAAPSDCYHTRDGWIVVPTIGEWMFSRWAKLMKREDLLEDSRFESDIARANHHSTINEIMSAWCMERTSHEALEALHRARIPCGPVHGLEDVLTEPAVRDLDLLRPVDYPTSPRPVPLTRSALRLDGEPKDAPRRAPTLGEHTEQVLSEWGFSQVEIRGLRAEEVI
ncbi:MAG: CoA transferase [Planctomycetota bacterium]